MSDFHYFSYIGNYLGPIVGGIIEGFTGFVGSIFFFLLLLGVVEKKIGNPQISKMIKFLLLLGTILGAILCIKGAFNSEPPIILRERWLIENQESILASNELKLRFEKKQCPICGKSAKWALDNIDADNDEDMKFILASDIKPKDQNVEFSCEDHTEYLDLINKGNEKDAREYLKKNYLGPGQSEIGFASKNGPITPKEENKLENALKLNITLLTILVGYAAFLFLAIAGEYKISDILD
jgi:hypothetical protein